MAVKNAEASPSVHQAFQLGLERAVRRRWRGDSVGGAAPTEQVYRHPLPVYTCTLDDLASGDATPRLSAWRYLLIKNNSVVETADVADELGGGPPVFRGLTRGGRVIPELDGALGVVGQLEHLGQYELRVLQIPALYTMALWLYDTAPHGDDRFVYVAEAPDGKRVVSSHEFWETAQRMAIQAVPDSQGEFAAR